MLSPDGNSIWNGSEWIPSPPNQAHAVEVPLPSLHTAYVLNFFFPGIGMLYLGRPIIGMLIYSIFLVISIFSIFWDSGIWLFGVLLMIVVVIDTKEEYQKMIKGIGK